jgi:hypothetical protein
MEYYRRRSLPFFGGLSVFVAVLMMAVPGFSQERRSAVFTPFISRLAVEGRNNLIRLTWADSRDAQGPVYVYRSKTPIDETRIAALENPVEVPYGVQSYIDEGEAQTTYYYYIAAGNAAGEAYQVVLPGINTISITLGAAADPGLSSPATGRSRNPNRRAELTGLEAKTQGDSVVITFRLGNSVQSGVVLYRSVQPITQYGDLRNAVIVRSGITPPFVDYPVPGIPYYYAAVFEDDLEAGQVEINSGENATVLPVELPAGQYRVGLPGAGGAIRSMPLPRISVHAAAPWTEGLAEIPPALPLSVEAAKVVADIGAPPRLFRKPAATPRAFSQDLRNASERGEDDALRSIVQGSFSQWDWTSCREELLRFLALPHGDQTEARARFYLGQAYYFSGLLREALFEFLAIQSAYPQESAEWVDAALNLLADQR